MVLWKKLWYSKKELWDQAKNYETLVYLKNYGTFEKTGTTERTMGPS